MLTGAESCELDDHDILLPARLTQEVLAVPAKPTPSFFGKLFQGLHRCWNFLQTSPLGFMVHSQRLHGSLPRGQGKWTRVCLWGWSWGRTRLHQPLADSTLSPLYPEWRLPKLPQLNSISLCLIPTSEIYLQMPLIKLVRDFSVQILFSIIAGK